MTDDTERGGVDPKPIRTAAFCLAVARKLDEIRSGAPAHVVLEVAADATPVDIRAAYRGLAKAFHPDTNRALIDEAPGIAHDLDEVLFALSVARRQIIGHSGPPGSVADARRQATQGRPDTVDRGSRARHKHPGPPAAATVPGPTRRHERREKSASDWYAEGRTLLAGRDPGGAAECFNRACQLEPGDAEYHRSMGEALAAAPGRRHDALAPLVEALRLDPNAEGTWFVLGEVREQLGALAGAREAYGRALALAPSNMRARLAVGRVTAALRDVPEPETGWRSRFGRRASG